MILTRTNYTNINLHKNVLVLLIPKWWWWDYVVKWFAGVLKINCLSHTENRFVKSRAFTYSFLLDFKGRYCFTNIVQIRIKQIIQWLCLSPKQLATKNLFWLIELDLRNLLLLNVLISYLYIMKICEIVDSMKGYTLDSSIQYVKYAVPYLKSCMKLK